MSEGSLIVVKKNGSEGSKFPMHKENVYKLGPGSDCHLRFCIENYTEHVCSISTNKKGPATITKLSSCPVLLNNNEIKTPKPLKYGDVIKIGPKTFKWGSLIQRESFSRNVFKNKTPTLTAKKLNVKSKRRSSLSDFRSSIIKSASRLSTWRETEENIKTSYNARENAKNIAVSNTPMKITSSEIEQKASSARSRTVPKNHGSQNKTPKSLSVAKNLKFTPRSIDKKSPAKKRYFELNSTGKVSKIPRKFFPDNPVSKIPKVSKPLLKRSDPKADEESKENVKTPRKSSRVSGKESNPALLSEVNVRTPDSVGFKPVTPNIKLVKSVTKKNASLRKSVDNKTMAKKRKISSVADEELSAKRFKFAEASLAGTEASLLEDESMGSLFENSLSLLDDSNISSPRRSLRPQNTILPVASSPISPKFDGNVSGIKSLIRTPGAKSPIKSVKTPKNESDAKRRFTESNLISFKSPNGQVASKPIYSTPKAQSFSLIDLSIEKIRRSPKTPKSEAQIKRKSGRLHKSPKNESTNKLLKTPIRTPKSPKSNVASVKKTPSRTPKFPKNDLTIIAGGVNKLSKTPVRLPKSPKNDLTNVPGVKKLLKTPGRAPKSPKNDLTNVAGVKKILKTPGRAPKSPKNDLTNVAGVKKLLKTPGRAPKSPKNDLTNVFGVKKLLKTPRKAPKSPKNDLTNVSGVKKLLKTPKAPKSPKNDLTNVAGVKKLLKTPKAPKSPKNDLTNVAGVKKLLKTPKAPKSPKNDLSNVAGVKRLLKSPRRPPKSPKNDLTNVAGVKNLLKTPKAPKSPKNDLSNVSGVKQLLKTPKVPKSPKNNLTTGVKKLLNPARPPKSPKNDLTNVSGVKKLLKTPKAPKSPKNDLTNVFGVKQLLKPQKSPKNDLSNIAGVKKLLKSPRRPQKSPRNDLANISDITNLFRSPEKPQKSPKSILKRPRTSESLNGCNANYLFGSPKITSESPKNVLHMIDVKSILKNSPNSPRTSVINLGEVKSILSPNSSISHIKPEFSTPTNENSFKSGVIHIDGVKQLLKVSGRNPKSPKNDLSDVLFNVSRMNSSVDSDAIFDQLQNENNENSNLTFTINSKSPLRTYERRGKSLSPEKLKKISDNRKSLREADSRNEINVQKWLNEHVLNKQKSLVKEAEILSSSSPTTRGKKATKVEENIVTPTLKIGRGRRKQEKEVEEALTPKNKHLNIEAENLSSSSPRTRRAKKGAEEDNTPIQATKIEENIVTSSLKVGRGRRKQKNEVEEVLTPKNKLLNIEAENLSSSSPRTRRAKKGAEEDNTLTQATKVEENIVTSPLKVGRARRKQKKEVEEALTPKNKHLNVEAENLSSSSPRTRRAKKGAEEDAPVAQATKGRRTRKQVEEPEVEAPKPTRRTRKVAEETEGSGRTRKRTKNDDEPEEVASKRLRKQEEKQVQFDISEHEEIPKGRRGRKAKIIEEPVEKKTTRGRKAKNVEETEEQPAEKKSTTRSRKTKKTEENAPTPEIKTTRNRRGKKAAENTEDQVEEQQKKVTRAKKPEDTPVKESNQPVKRGRKNKTTEETDEVVGPTRSKRQKTEEKITEDPEIKPRSTRGRKKAPEATEEPVRKSARSRKNK